MIPHLLPSTHGEGGKRLATYSRPPVFRPTATAFLISMFLIGLPQTDVWGDPAAELQERITDRQRSYDERLAEYHRAVEAMTAIRGDVEAGELALELRKEAMDAALEKLEEVQRLSRNRSDLSDEQEKKTYAAAQAAYGAEQSSLHENRVRLATAEGEATAVYVALQGYRDELLNLHRQLANARFRSLQEELSQTRTVVVREEMGCENLTIQACKEGALERAKRSAVEQGSVVLLESETVMEEMQVFLGSGAVAEDRQVTRDWIASHVEGLLVGYDVIARGWVGESGYFYEIEAVVMGQLSRDHFDLVGDETIPALPDSEHADAARPAIEADQVAHRGAGAKFRDCPECPELVVVPPGSFVMGSPTHEAGRMRSEGPAHTVTLSYPLAVGVYEVTFAEWEACARDGGCARYRPDDMRWGGASRPVINVSWDDAVAYLDWLSEATGHRYRLLSESEWEYAARAGTPSPFHTGDTISTDQANYDGEYVYGPGAPGRSRQQTVSVGSFAPNAFGLHDVHGNAWEWVEDCWHDSYLGAPTNGAAWTTGDCSRRVLRGGSWFEGPRFLRSGARVWSSTGNRDVNIGFRVARPYRARFLTWDQDSMTIDQSAMQV